jgi:predicted MFS family arabinose efflux permease
MAATRNHWLVIATFALLGGVNQMLWVTYAPVTDAAGEHYGVSANAIGWLANIFTLLYVLLAVPAGMVLDRWFRSGLAAGAILTAAGALIRLAGEDYAWALAGQIVIGIAQPLVLNAITGITTRYLAERDRATGIAIGTAGTFAGLTASFALGSQFADATAIRTLLGIDAALAVIVAIAVLVSLRTPVEHRAGQPQPGIGALRIAWRDPFIRLLCAVVFVPFGVFIALTTFAQPLLAPAGVPEATVGLMLTANVVAGVIGCAVVPIWASRNRTEVAFLRAGLLVTALACTVLAVVPGTGTGFVTIIVLGFVQLSALPVVLELTERRAGEAEGTASGLMWLAGNLGGLVVTAVVGLIVDYPMAAFLLLAVLTLAAVPLVTSFRKYLAPASPTP